MKWLVGVIGVMSLALMVWAIAVTWNSDSNAIGRSGPPILAFIPGLFLLGVDMALLVFWGLWRLFTS